MPWWWLTAIAVSLVINEVLYDPDGTDGGHEFIELFNGSADTLSLQGITVDFINGARPDERRRVWSGGPGDRIGPGGFFVLGEDQVGARDRTVSLGLQNGDEALVLERGGERLDAVAWGALPGLGEGAPVPPVAGTSLGRVPDGADSGDNLRDFEELPRPNPGAPNRPAQELTLAAWWPEPVWREDAGPTVLHLRLVASGWEGEQSAVVEVWGEERAVHTARGEEAEVAFERGLEPGEPAPALSIRSIAGDRVIVPLPLRAGVDALVLTEVQPRPVDGEPEWFEVLNRSGDELALEGWEYRDRGGRQRALGEQLRLPPGGRLILTADADRFAEVHPAAGPVMTPAGGWATLNDTDPGAGVAADSLHLIAPDGAVVDLVTWRRADIEERGRSLQRSRVEPGQASIWLPSLTGPSPGTGGVEEERRWPGQGMVCAPDPFTPDGDGVDDVLEVLVLAPAVRRVVVFDLAGDPVRPLEFVEAGGRVVARWDGTDARGRSVPPGAWVVVVESEVAGKALRQVVGLGRLW